MIGINSIAAYHSWRFRNGKVSEENSKASEKDINSKVSKKILDACDKNIAASNRPGDGEADDKTTQEEVVSGPDGASKYYVC